MCAAPRVIVIADHVVKVGIPEIVAECDLPLTGVGVVDRIITDRAVFGVIDHALVLRGLAPGYDADEILACTGASFSVQLGS